MPPLAAASAILWTPLQSPSQACLGAGQPRRSPHLARRLMPSCMKVNDDSAVSYRVADEEVQLRSPDEDLPKIFQVADFSTTPLLVVPPPPQYSTLPRMSRQLSNTDFSCSTLPRMTSHPSHAKLSHHLSTLSN
jgi:hypothetical protein